MKFCFYFYKALILKNKNAFLNQVYRSVSNTIKESIELPNMEPKDLSKYDIPAHDFQNYLSNIKSVIILFYF